MQIRLRELGFVVRESGLAGLIEHGPVRLLAGFLHTLCSPVQQEGGLAGDPTRMAAEALDIRTEPTKGQRNQADNVVVENLQVPMSPTEFD
jgi:hypothetical protein